MALSLGYSRIRQTDMIRNYYPDGHSNLNQYDNDFRAAVLTYLRSGAAVFAQMIENIEETKKEKQAQ
jgi:hypothetical protein